MKSLAVNSGEVNGIEDSKSYKRIRKIIMVPDLHRNRGLAIGQLS